MVFLTREVFAILWLHSCADGAREGGHDIRCVALRELEFDLVLRAGTTAPNQWNLTSQSSRNSFNGCEHLVVVSPNWWWSVPALLKGYIDRVFLPGFAMRFHPIRRLALYSAKDVVDQTRLRFLADAKELGRRGK